MSTEFDYRLFRALNGGLVESDPLPIGRIPIQVQRKLGWTANSVYLTNKDTQKIRFHPQHGMDSVRGQMLPLVLSAGDYYQQNNRGSKLQIQIVLHEPNPKRAYYLVLSRNKQDTGIFIRTFFFDSNISRSKMKKAERLRVNPNNHYFIMK